MNIDAAHTLKSRLLFRISHEPTQSARTLRAVIEQHSPDADPPPDEHDVTCRVCHTPRGRSTLYPCPTVGLVALELSVPIPDDPTYRSLIDG